MRSKIAENLSLRCKFITSKTVEMVVIDSDTNEIWIKRINFRDMPKVTVEQVEKLRQLEGPTGNAGESQGAQLGTTSSDVVETTEVNPELSSEEKEDTVNE